MSQIEKTYIGKGTQVKDLDIISSPKKNKSLGNNFQRHFGQIPVALDLRVIFTIHGNNGLRAMVE